MSVFPATTSDKNTPVTANLIAANGTVIKSYGLKSIKLQLSSLALSHVFRLADVSQPILGSVRFLCQDCFFKVLDYDP